MSSGDMSFREKCLIGRNVLGRNVLGRTVLGRNGFWGEMSDIPCINQLKKLISKEARKWMPRLPRTFDANGTFSYLRNDGI